MRRRTVNADRHVGRADTVFLTMTRETEYVGEEIEVSVPRRDRYRSAWEDRYPYYKSWAIFLESISVKDFSISTYGGTRRFQPSSSQAQKQS